MLCANCASPNPDDAQFCSDCGTTFLKAPVRNPTPAPNKFAEAAPKIAATPDYTRRQATTLVLPSVEQIQQPTETSRVATPINPPSSLRATPQVQANNNLAKLVVGSVLAVAVILGAVAWGLRKPADSHAPGNKEAEQSHQQPLETEPRNKPTNSPAPPPQMTYVPGGEFFMGSNNGDEFERPQYKVQVRSFFIDLYEVTREQYAEFIKATGYSPPPGWQNNQYPPGTARWPVTGVNWDDANAYGRWTGKRLPTEEEWEFAARGTDGRRYPWGNEWKPNAANGDQDSRGRLANVGERRDGASPFGLLDMVGNAWEWTASNPDPYPGGRLSKKPVGDVKVIRGGSWQEDRNATATYRGYLLARGGKDYSNTGFRCVKDAPLSSASK